MSYDHSQASRGQIDFVFHPGEIDRPESGLWSEVKVLPSIRSGRDGASYLYGGPASARQTMAGANMWSSRLW